MRRVCAYRANKILFNFIKSNKLAGTVVLPANICSEVVETLLYSGCALQFVDIDARTLCLDWLKVKSIAKDVVAILAVHTYGVEDDFNDQFINIRIVNPNIVIIDDCCLCMPMTNEPNSSADLVLYSTGGKKQVELGVGGIGFVAEKWQYKDMVVPENKVLMNAKWESDDKKLYSKMYAVIKHKEKLNTIYQKNLPTNIQLPERYQHWRFNIIVPNKEEILKALFDEGLFASSHYAVSTHAWCADEFLISTNLHQHVINLFNDFYYTEEQAYKTCEVIKRYI